MAVADVVEAMASHRPYRPSLGIDAALDEMERGRGTAYDRVLQLNGQDTPAKASCWASA